MEHLAIRYHESGDLSAPSLMLFLHGGGVSGWMWGKQIEYFTHVHCIVPDLPEHGASHNGMHFSIKNSAMEFIQLLEEKAKGKKVILVGFSLGSQIILQMLSLKPTLADYAIINSALVRPNPYMKKLLSPSVKLSFPLIKQRWFSKLQAKTLYIGEDDFEKYYKESIQMKLDTLVRVLEENMSFAIPNDFRKATGKILVTIGAKEKAIMKQSAKDIVKMNANCTGIIIPDMGHGLPLAKPEFFNHMVETWIQKGDLPTECQVII